MIDGSVTGGPVVPTPTHPLIQSAYAALSPSDTYICNFETSRQFTLSGLSGITMANALRILFPAAIGALIATLILLIAPEGVLPQVATPVQEPQPQQLLQLVLMILGYLH